jgi:hypothetical protein
VLYIKIEVSPFWMHYRFYSFYVTWNQIVSSFLGGHPVFMVDLHFATCGAIDILRPLPFWNVYGLMKSFHIMKKVHISTESAYFHRWELGLELLKIDSLYSLRLKLMNWTSIKYLRMHNCHKRLVNQPWAHF